MKTFNGMLRGLNKLTAKLYFFQPEESFSDEVLQSLNQTTFANHDHTISPTTDTDSDRPSIPEKRKNRNGSNSESDSSDPIKSKSKKAKRSRISETSEEQTSSSEDKVISPPPPPNESPRSRHRRIQMDIRSKNGHQRNTSKT